MPYEHHQNGVAERLNRTIGDMGRTMLLASGLSESMWSFAYLTAAYLHNRIPNSLTGDKTPLELPFDKKPNLEGVRTFGERAIVHIHGERRNKLQA